MWIASALSALGSALGASGAAGAGAGAATGAGGGLATLGGAGTAAATTALTPTLASIPTAAAAAPTIGATIAPAAATTGAGSGLSGALTAGSQAMGGIPGAIEAGVNGSGTGFMGTVSDMLSGYAGGNSAAGMKALSSQTGLSEGAMSGIKGILGQQAGPNKGGGGGGGGGPLGEIGALLSKSKNSGQMQSASTPQPIDLSQGIQAAAEARAASDPGQADRSPMDINGFISQIMGGG
jgi:hypothetical protein